MEPIRNSTADSRGPTHPSPSKYVQGYPPFHPAVVCKLLGQLHSLCLRSALCCEGPAGRPRQFLSALEGCHLLEHGADGRRVLGVVTHGKRRRIERGRQSEEGRRAGQPRGEVTDHRQILLKNRQACG